MRQVVLFLLLFSVTLVHAGEDSFSERAVLFSGSANPELADQIAEQLGVTVGKADLSTYNDGEVSIRLQENVRNKDVYIVQSTCRAESGSVNDSLMQLYLMVRAAKRASAGSVTAVIPYYGYARQDRKTQPRVPISAADVATLIETAGADRVVSVDLHCGQIQGFFRDIPVDNLYAATVFTQHYASKKMDKVVVVSPDAGGVTRAKEFMAGLKKSGVDAKMAMIVKQRKQAGVVASMDLVGDVEGADVVIVDDICDSGGTLCKAAQLLKDSGAKHVYAAITHPVFSGPALDRVRDSVLDELTIADTIPLSLDAPENIRQVSVAPMLAETIRRIQNGESVSELFG